MKYSILTLSCLTVAFANPLLLWPEPQAVEWGNVKVSLEPSFQINGPQHALLQEAIQRYTHLIVKERWSPVMTEPITTMLASLTLRSLKIEVADTEADLTFGVDEAYDLEISPKEISGILRAQTVWGALRGLETFSQLIQGNVKDEDAEEKKPTDFQGLFIPYAPIHIMDEPRFPHRGLMLDTARNFFPVFHWHITDSQSFPLALESAPELAQKGAYRLHGKRLIYTKADVQRIVRYAHSRGIRVIPEIDMPGHAGSWAESYKHLTTCSDKFYLDPTNDWEKRYAAEPGSGQLNPVLKETYVLLKKVIEEVATLFPDAWYHGGGDEPVYKCWEDSKSVRDYMAKHNVTGQDLLHTFLQKEIDIIEGKGKTSMLWEDSVTDNHLPLSKNIVLQVWKNPVSAAVRAGHKVVASSANFWYLDCGRGQWSGNDTSIEEQVEPPIPKQVEDVMAKYSVSDNYNPSNWGGSGGDWCSPFKSWQRMYSYDITYGLGKNETKNVLGGEAVLWSEQSDETTVDARLWPRSAATAEVLWSGNYDRYNTKRHAGDAMPRMFDWRYRLLKRGIRAEPIQPLWWYVFFSFLFWFSWVFCTMAMVRLARCTA
ncbi:glycoside hydrolase superfamily [Spinellus fusiger]|nr:glycoside hydrolase superfamily [Spinellus fusiger]